MSLSKPIPPKLKERLNDDPFMAKCCLAKLGGCLGRVEFHHNFQYQGRRINEFFCILPVCTQHHIEESTYKRYLNSIMLKRMVLTDFRKYDRVNWDVMRKTCLKF